VRDVSRPNVDVLKAETLLLAPEPALTGLLHPIGTASLQSSNCDCVGEHPVKHLSVLY